MITIRKLSFVLVGVLCLATPALAETEIKLAHSGPRGSILDLTAQEFAKLANAALGRQATVTIYPAAQLGSDTAVLQKVKAGTVDLALPGSVMSSAVPLFGLFEMPYLVRDRDHFARIRDQIIMPLMTPVAEKAGFKVIAVWENGFRHITNNRQPIRTPADVKGLKLRVPPGEWRIKMFQAYGAAPAPLAFSKLYSALQNGEMTGEENPLAIIYPGRLYEVQKYISLTGHVYAPAYLIAGASWSKFAPNVQRILKEAAEKTQNMALKLGAELDGELLAKLKAAGMQVNDVDKEAFIAASAPIYDAFSTQIPEGKRLIEKALALGR
jgi:tripartite ATP-independent transporter DctP family solute receptor